jgi:RsiW-degrading membrane proteinase PrsW (M82 family)
MLPIFALPQFLLFLEPIHLISAAIAPIMFGSTGLVILASNVPGYTGTPKEKSNIRSGVLAVGYAVACLLFGFYATAPLLMVMFLYLIYILLSGIVIAST